MSESSGSGAALDVTARIAELGDRPEVVALDNERMALHHALYDQLVNDTSTAVYAAHVAQLRRLRDEAMAALRGARAALVKAREHAAGKEDAVREAETTLDSAEMAVAEATGSAV